MRYKPGQPLAVIGNQPPATQDQQIVRWAHEELQRVGAATELHAEEHEAGYTGTFDVTTPTGDLTLEFANGLLVSVTPV